MTDQDRPDPDSEEERIRRLLAEARHTEPMPDRIAARLDAVLAELGAEPTPSGTPATEAEPAPVPDLAAARRRRNARTWLAAAAAVVAIGVGVGELADLARSGGGDSDATSADSTAEHAGTPSTGAGSRAKGPNEPVQLSASGFARQVARLQRLVVDGSAAVPTERPGTLDRLTGTRPEATAACITDGPGRQLPVRYGGRPGILVFRPVRGDTQVVDLYLCDGSGIARSVTLPVR